MNIVYSVDGDLSLLTKKFSRRLPEADIVCDCVKNALSKGDNLTSKVVRMTQKDVKNDVAKCEPALFLLYREFSVWAKNACEAALAKGCISYDKVLLRLPSHASPREVLTSGILAKCCGVKQLTISMAEGGYTHEHSMAARLCGADEVILTDEVGCIREAICKKYDLLCGHDSDLFSVLAGAISPYIDVHVHHEVKGRTIVLCEHYKDERPILHDDIDRELYGTNGERLVIISANHDALVGLLPVGYDGLSALITTSDEESFAAAKKLNSNMTLVYGEFDRSRYPEFIEAIGIPPLMREVVLPFSLSPIRPSDFQRIPSGMGSEVEFEDFAKAISKYIKNAMTAEDCQTFVSRL